MAASSTRASGRSSPSDQAITPPDLSVCVVNWNLADTLRQCLRSLFATVSLSGLDIEVIVVDNGSTDGSLDMVRREFPQARLAALPTNELFAAACNEGAARAKGRHVLFLNNDTEVDCRTLAEMVRFVDEQRQVGACGPVLTRPDGSLERAYERFPTVPWQLAKLLGLSSLAAALAGRDRPYRTPIAPGSCLMVRGELGRELGFFDTGFRFYYEEVDLCYRIWESGHQVWVLPQCTVRHAHARSAQQMDESERLRHLHSGYARFVTKHRRGWRRRLLWWLFNLTLLRKAAGYALLTGLTLGLSRRVRGKLGQAAQSVRLARGMSVGPNEATP